MIRKLAPILTFAALSFLHGPSSAGAQEHTWTLSALGGFGGSLDESGSPDLGLQLGGALQSAEGTNVWVKVGTFGFDTGSDAGSIVDGDVTYLAIGGEYQFFERYYHSGVFLGLGAYQIDGHRALAGGGRGPKIDDTSIGLLVGVSGEFRLTPNFAFLVEVAGHVLNSDDARVYATGHGGVAIHF